MALVVQNLPASVGDARDAGSIPGLGIPFGEGNGYPLQYSCLENPMDRGVWWGSKELDTTKEISPGISLEGMMLKLKLQYFGHLM